MDLLSGGRLEVGVGAGHAFPEYEAAGIAFDPPALRKRRLAESVEILRRLLDGERRSSRRPLRTGWPRHRRAGAGPRARPGRVNGRAALDHAARHADIIGLTMLGKTLPDGNAHSMPPIAGRGAPPESHPL